MNMCRGIPREEIPWFPTISQEACIGCKTCIECCKNEVLAFDEEAGKARVVNPYNCVVECRTCARLCPTNAISFPEEQQFNEILNACLLSHKEKTS
jgi:NAD-dependent dihydropyrimidine dehydrogenase PreA subunit